MVLARMPLVVVRMSAHEGRARVRFGRRREGFSLMELMVVIVLIALLALLALPSMGDARYDRTAYSDAGQILELARMARTRAVGRGGAVVLEILAGNGNLGQVRVWDAVRPNADINVAGGAGSSGGVGGDNRTPVTSCKAPTAWTLNTANPSNGTAALIEEFDMNNPIEQQGAVTTTVIDNAGNTVNAAYICFTPLGRTYYASGTPNFDNAPIFTGGIQVFVTRADPAVPARVYNLQYRGPARTIVIPSSGMARLVSQ
jgi:type IV fimbrial biogenesis protein FimT